LEPLLPYREPATHHVILKRSEGSPKLAGLMWEILRDARRLAAFNDKLWPALTYRKPAALIVIPTETSSG